MPEGVTMPSYEYIQFVNEKALESVERWRSRPLARACPYVCVDGIHLAYDALYRC